MQIQKRINNNTLPVIILSLLLNYCTTSIYLCQSFQLNQPVYTKFLKFKKHHLPFLLNGNSIHVSTKCHGDDLNRYPERTLFTLSSSSSSSSSSGRAIAAEAMKRRNVIVMHMSSEHHPHQEGQQQQQQKQQQQQQQQQQQTNDTKKSHHPSSTSSSKNPPTKTFLNKTSLIINTLSILGLSSAFIMFWSECSIILTKCSPVSLSIPMERSAYLSSFLFASGTNLSKIIFGCSMTELLFQDDFVHNNTYYDRKKKEEVEVERKMTLLGTKNLQIGLFYATEVVAFMAVVSAFAVVIWQIAQGVEMPGSDERWCHLINE